MVTGTERLTLSVEETAKLLGISKNSAYLAIRNGEIPSLRIGSRLLVPVAALQKLLSNAGQGEVSHER